MGPDTKAIEQVKLDAIKGTLRHFANDALDNDYEPLVNLDEVRDQLIAENTTSDEPAAKSASKPAAKSKKDSVDVASEEN